jgi:hypothetical protein
MFPRHRPARRRCERAAPARQLDSRAISQGWRFCNSTGAGMIINIDKTVELIEYQSKIFATDNKLSEAHVFAAMLIGAGIVLTEESRNL